eukprot:GHVN01011346.1.p1 GENE.GHVN01011346.1~~GHVN01011346.1.p1  ORF type:complete len:154 (+),score=44.83 GHVN01011346.1:847-1308(+)
MNLTRDSRKLSTSIHLGTTSTPLNPYQHHSSPSPSAGWRNHDETLLDSQRSDTTLPNEWNALKAREANLSDAVGREMRLSECEVKLQWRLRRRRLRKQTRSSESHVYLNQRSHNRDPLPELTQLSELNSTSVEGESDSSQGETQQAQSESKGR